MAEVGGGSGISLIMLAQEGAFATNFDISQGALGFFEYLAQQYGVHERVRTKKADFANLPEKDGKYDLTYNVGVFEHFGSQKRKQILDEMVRITRHGGIVMVSVPNPKSPYYQMMKSKEDIVEEDKKFPMPFVEDVDPEELLKRGGLRPLPNGTYGRGYTLIAPPTRLTLGTISPNDLPFFKDLVRTVGENPTVQQLYSAWDVHEDRAVHRRPDILEKYGMFTHAFGVKS